MASWSTTQKTQLKGPEEAEVNETMQTKEKHLTLDALERRSSNWLVAPGLDSHLPPHPTLTPASLALSLIHPSLISIPTLPISLSPSLVMFTLFISASVASESVPVPVCLPVSC